MRSVRFFCLFWHFVGFALVILYHHMSENTEEKITQKRCVMAAIADVNVSKIL